MNKIVMLVLMSALVLPSGLALAQESGMKKEGMMDKGMMGMGMMMKMMEKSAIATSDGGIVLVSVDKLSKYDKDLNLVKEIELKSDMAAMQKMMSEMMEKCPMMGKGMMGKNVDKASDSLPAAKPAVPAIDDVDHASHHK